MTSWIKALSKTRNVFKSAMTRVLSGQGVEDEETLEELEEALLTADVSARLVDELLISLEKDSRKAGQTKRAHLGDILASQLEQAPFDWTSLPRPGCILLVGINGSGKTTTSAKLAALCKAKGMQPLLGAADTFRAAGTDQLRIWAERVGCEVVAGHQGADAASVAFDALDAAVARKADVLLLDTAGRMHTKQPLMQELEKMKRALAKRMEAAPHEVWMVLDGSNGQNAIAQARVFHTVVPLTGVIATKLDGSSKAGFIFSVRRELGVPVHFVGLGEHEDDLVPFDPRSFVEALLNTGSESANAEVAN